jgi:glucose-6-phosphate isomerase
MFPGYEQDLEGAIGPRGLSKESLIGLSESLREYLRELQRSRESNDNKILALVDKTDDLEKILTTAFRISEGAETVVILGTGGSSLGGQTLVRLADLGFGPKPGRPHVIFFDNIDPVTFRAFFHTSDPQKTRFIAISKSGDTAETILQTELCLSWIKASGGPLPKDVFTIITEEKPSTLAQIAMAHDIPRIVHCPDIGGRYSSFSNVGLLPAAIAGLDISAIRLAGAAAMDASLKASPDKSPAALGAALNIGLSQQKEHLC